MPIGFERDGFALSLAQSETDLADAQRLRYDVFCTELGAGGPGADHETGRESDRFDAHADHLILRDLEQGETIGAYRLMTADQARAAGSFYSESEYDLTPLARSGRRLLELGRSCVRADHRGGPAMFHLWTGLAAYVAAQQTEVIFGVASFKGTQSAALAGPLSLLHHRHRAPDALRPRARVLEPMDLCPPEQIDRRAAMQAMPPLIKAYLRLGGMVGEGAFVDHAFNCIDVCMVMDTQTLNARQARFYTQAAE